MSWTEVSSVAIKWNQNILRSYQGQGILMPGESNKHNFSYTRHNYKKPFTSQKKQTRGT